MARGDTHTHTHKSCTSHPKKEEKKKNCMLTQEQVDAQNASVVFVFAFLCVWTVFQVLCDGHRDASRALL